MGDLIKFQQNIPDGHQRGEEETCGDTLGLIGTSLKELISNGESHFVSIGVKLQDFTDRARKLSGMSLSAVRIMSGDEISGAISGLQEMLTQLNTLLDHSDGQNVRNQGSMEKILKLIRNLHRNLLELKGTAKTLRMLALSIKIHSTKISRNEGEYEQLAKDVSTLSEQIFSVLSDLTGRTEQLIKDLEGARNNIRKLSLEQRTQARKIMVDAGNVVDSLRTLSSNSSLEAALIADRTDEISGSIEQVVVSMQYQDITRQKLEKVQLRLGTLSENNPLIFLQHRNLKYVDHVENIRDLLEECESQADHLLLTRRELKAAVKSIMENLSRIELNIGEMSEAAGEACKVAVSFIVELEMGMSTVTSFLEKVLGSNKEMSETMTSLVETITDMTKFISDIEDIASEVELIALNSKIKSTQTGADATGMTIIAGSMQLVAKDAENQRGILLDDVSRIKQSADELKAEIESFAGGDEAQLGNMVRELGVLLDALRYMQEKVVSILSKMDVEGSNLAHDISGAVSEINAHQSSIVVIDEATSRLKNISGSLRETFGKQIHSHSQEEEEFNKTAIHEGEMKGLFADQAECTGEILEKEDTTINNPELFDGVELFHIFPSKTGGES
jgi:methyl-accepting chemotaxis protein